MNCSICGSNVTDLSRDLPYKVFELQDGENHKEYARLKKKYGTTKVVVCWSCFFKSLGVKSIEKGKTTNTKK